MYHEVTYEVCGVNVGSVVDQLLQHVDMTKPRGPQQRRHANLYNSNKKSEPWLMRRATASMKGNLGAVRS